MHHPTRTLAGSLAIAFCLLAPPAGRLQAQGTITTVGRVVPMADRRVTAIGADESVVEATGLPRPDLVPRQMCLTRQTSGQRQEVRVLVENAGSADADSFSVGLSYRNGHADSLVAAVEGAPGLAAGRSAWFTYRAVWDVVAGPPASYTAIADPRYSWVGVTTDAFGRTTMGLVEGAPRIRETDERNNTLTLDRSGIAGCDQLIRQGVRRIPPRPR